MYPEMVIAMQGLIDESETGNTSLDVEHFAQEHQCLNTCPL